MADLQLTMGTDLSVSPTGDLALVTGTQAGQERVLRRLLTNPGDYIWHLEYGAGLPAMVGQPARARVIEGISRAQMYLEPAVSQTTPPVVTVTASIDGTVVETVRYVDADTGESQILTAQASA
jgi:phage baseplate assembly protein W